MRKVSLSSRSLCTQKSTHFECELWYNFVHFSHSRRSELKLDWNAKSDPFPVSRKAFFNVLIEMWKSRFSSIVFSARLLFLVHKVQRWWWWTRVRKQSVKHCDKNFKFSVFHSSLSPFFFHFFCFSFHVTTKKRRQARTTGCVTGWATGFDVEIEKYSRAVVSYLDSSCIARISDWKSYWWSFLVGVLAALKKGVGFHVDWVLQMEFLAQFNAKSQLNRDNGKLEWKVELSSLCSCRTTVEPWINIMLSNLTVVKQQKSEMKNVKFIIYISLWLPLPSRARFNPSRQQLG